ncbi:MAG: hypothetical protein IPK82_27720 [Polyangiaceae bacterium]|nr:hypothetical protein [Polyangiaceae bacterium]
MLTTLNDAPKRRSSPFAPSNGPQLITETKLMQQYRIGAAVHGGGDLAAIRNGTGVVEAFTIGTDGNVWDFASDSTSQTGVTSAKTGLVASGVSVGRNAQGRLVVFAANNLVLNYVVENAPGSSERWGSVQTAQLPLPQGAIKIAAIFTSAIGGKLYVGVLTQVQNVIGKSYTFSYSIWDDGPGVFQTTTLTLSTLNCVWSGHNRDTAEFTCLDLVYLGFNIASQTIIRRQFSATFTSFAVATVLDGAGNNRFFAILNDGNLYQMVGGGTNPFSWAQLTQQRSFRQITPATDSHGDVHLFTLGSNGGLWHFAPGSTTSGFADPIVIQSEAALLAATALDQGNLQLFVVTRAQATMLEMVWQKVAGNWQTSRVLVPTSKEVEEVSSYSTDLQVLDAVGSPVPNAPVQVSASEQTEIMVNGSFYTISPDTPAHLTTSAAGFITVTQQTNTLAIPVLEFAVDSISPGQSVAVEQSAGVQQRLEVLTGPELMDARVADGSFLLGEQYRNPETTASLASACNEAMALTKAGTNQLGDGPMFSRQGKKRGVGVIPRGTAADLTRVTADHSPHWAVSFRGGKVAFTKLTPEEAATRVAEMRARTPHLSRAGGFLDWIGAIGDFIVGIAEGIVDVVETVITTIGDAIHAVITFIADGVEYLFNTVVEFVEQAFDLVETFFAQVKVFFEKVFEWLGFIFNWNDILRTREAMAYATNQFMGFLPLAVGAVQTLFDNAIANVQSQVDAFFDQLVNEVGGGSLGGYTDTNTPSEPNFSSANANNIILNATLENASSASSAVIRAVDSGPFDVLVQLIKTLVDAVENNEAFDQALTLMQNLGGSLDQIFVQIVQALLRVVQGLAKVMLAGVQAVVDAVLQLVQSFLNGIIALLNDKWDIPFVTTFYSWITGGSDLTLLDLLSLVVAIPSTILFKILKGAAPFPDQASVEQFKASFTSQTMFANSGLAPTHVAAQIRAAHPPANPDNVIPFQLLVSVGSFLSFAGYGILTAAMDVQPTKDLRQPPAIVKTLTKITLALEILAQALACPWIFSAGAPDCSTSAGAGRWFWIYESLGVTLDAGFAYYEEAFPENNDTSWGIGIAELYGVGHAVITAALGSKLTALGLASKIVLVIPECCKFLKLPRIELATKGISLIVIAALDGLCILASGVLSFADSISPSPELRLRLNSERVPGAV